MPKVAETLTERALAKRVREAMAEGRPKLIAVGDVPGLHLQVRPPQGTAGPGTRSWVLRYLAGRTAEGKPWRRDVGLGGYPDLGLAEARAKARELRAQIRSKVDVIEAKRSERAAIARGLSFDEAAKRLIASKRHGWKNAKHAAQWETSLATYASPHIGKMPVERIEVADVERVLSPIWATKTETASRVRMRIEAVLSWATVAGYRSGENPARWRGNLEHVFAQPTKVAKVESFAAIPYATAPDFMRELRTRHGIAPRALEFLILTAARSGEVRGATWGEIDEAAKVWTVPAGRMKAGEEHRVPLSAEALDLLRQLPRFKGCELIFPGAKGGPLSENTFGKIIDLMHRARIEAEQPGLLDAKTGRIATAHGFRSAFRDWAAESTAYPNHVVEKALAHSIGNAVEAAYRRGDLFAKRAKLMRDWSAFLSRPAAAGATPINKARAAGAQP